MAKTSFQEQNPQYQGCLSHTSYLLQTFSLNLLRADRKAEWRPKITGGQLNGGDKWRHLPQVPDIRKKPQHHTESTMKASLWSMFPVADVISYNYHKHWCICKKQVHRENTVIQSIDQIGVWWFHPDIAAGIREMCDEVGHQLTCMSTKAAQYCRSLLRACKWNFRVKCPMIRVCTYTTYTPLSRKKKTVLHFSCTSISYVCGTW